MPTYADTWVDSTAWGISGRRRKTLEVRSSAAGEVGSDFWAWDGFQKTVGPVTEQ